MRLFSDRDRPVHLGPYPAERLDRGPMPDLSDVAPLPVPDFDHPDRASAIHAVRDFQAMLDAIRDGLVAKVRSDVPADPVERANHLKAFAYFNDASIVGTGPVPAEALLAEPLRNPDIDALAHRLATEQTKTLAAGIDLIMADLKESMAAPPSSIEGQGHALVILQEWHRDPREGEPAFPWIAGAQPHRAALRAAENAVVVANYLRVLGFPARAHTATSTDVCLMRLAVASGLVTGEGENPFLGRRFGLAAVTTGMEIAHDALLAARQSPSTLRRMKWWTGWGTRHSAFSRDPYAKRDYASGPHPFEKLTRVDEPTTYIDEARVPRVPKRTDMFARAQFGDMGKTVQQGATRGAYVNKAAPSAGQRRVLGAFVPLQDGEQSREQKAADPKVLADSIKALAYFLGVDAVGISRCPPWAWYSHDATGEPIDPPHDQAISMIVDQGFETMEGASGDDWISVAQSMRAYLRFSLVGGVVAHHIRRLGWPAKAHTVIDGDVLQPPLLLLSGLGEVSRIGEVILNPFLGPRLKSGVVTTTMPMAHDRPIDFGLQRFCESCNKCARECPSGAITAGPKRMFNGYEIWKSDSQKCATYRITTPGGAMCGRCMKTCPWNLEGLFAEAPFRWAAMNVPGVAPHLAKLDDALGRGAINPVKTWWWDLERRDDGSYRPTGHPVNRRGISPELEVKAEDQTMAVYPAPLAPHPYPYPFPMEREAGIAAFEGMVGADEWRERIARGEDGSWLHRARSHADAPVMRLTVAKVEKPVPDVALYTLARPDGDDLPEWEAGAHVDVVVAPEYLRPYSMCGDPADRSHYRIAVLNEHEAPAGVGRGGSALMHRVFEEGRRVFVSHPVNHFPLVEDATRSYLMGGGIGVTPMVAMAHRLHALGRPFELHYSVTSEDSGAFLRELGAAPWSENVRFHVSVKGSRADLDAILRYEPGAHVYTCGPERYMDAVIQAATRAGFPQEARHLEYFAVPEEPDYEDFAFTLRLADGREIAVSRDETAADALNAAGVAVPVKCSDGLCGVCRCGLVAGEVEHRDHVLSAAQRETNMILCRSRALEPDGIVEIDL